MEITHQHGVRQEIEKKAKKVELNNGLSRISSKASATVYASSFVTVAMFQCQICGGRRQKVVAQSSARPSALSRRMHTRWKANSTPQHVVLHGAVRPALSHTATTQRIAALRLLPNAGCQPPHRAVTRIQSRCRKCWLSEEKRI